MAGIAITWLGHAGFKIVAPKGQVILVDPWLDNPKCPEAAKHFDRVDAIFVTHGHFDHLGNTIDLSKKHGAQVVGIYELSLFLGQKGLSDVIGMNMGGTVEAGGVAATMVRADHSGGFLDGDRIVYCGSSYGFVFRFDNGTAVYHAGDTNVFGDMALIAKLYRPEVALLPIGGLYTMAPYEAAEAVRLLAPKKVVPMHYGTFPPLAGTPAELRRELGDHPAEVVALQPGGTVVV